MIWNAAELWTVSARLSGRMLAITAGSFPASDSPPEIPDESWIVPDPSGMRYIYTSGLVADEGKKPLAYEPGIFGNDRFVLLSSGEIVRMSEDDLVAALAERRP